MRPLAIFLLVVWHSFIIYTGGWMEPVGLKFIEGYWWIAKLSYACMLELFVFVSGYVLGLTLERKNPSFQSLLVSKFRRLIIPSLFFSVIYYLLFYSLDNFTLVGTVWSVLNGCGHMWFLPMLFWTTLFSFVWDKLKLPQWLKLIGVYSLPILSLLPIPLGLSSAMYYIPFFYTGLVIYRLHDKIVQRLYNTLWINILYLGVVFVLMFIATTLISRDVLSVYIDSENFILKSIAFLCRKYLQLLCAISGIISVYGLVNYLLEVKNVKVPQWVIELNTTCFGIYLFQQFILRILYYKTPLPTLVGPYWLPWVGLMATLVLSYALTKLSLKTKLGRQLM